MEGQKPVGVEQQVTKNASESHPHQLSQKGCYGREGGGRGRAKGEEKRTEKKKKSRNRRKVE